MRTGDIVNYDPYVVKLEKKIKKLLKDKLMLSTNVIKHHQTQ